MSEYILHSFEAGRRGKPDELDAGIAHLIGAYFLEQNPLSRFDLRVSGGYNLKEDKPVVRVSGEISQSLFNLPTLQEDISQVIINHYNLVHQTAYPLEHFNLEYEFKPQSDELASNKSAGDSGNPIAVAYRTTPTHLPWERYLAVEIRDFLDSIFQRGGRVDGTIASAADIHALSGLRADGKVGVNVLYEGSRVVKVEQVTIAAEHEEKLSADELSAKVEKMVGAMLREEQKNAGTYLHSADFTHPAIIINGLGKPWTQGGWRVDEGSREAKSYRDGFGSYGSMEDSFSGEDPSKPSATGTFLARYIAVQIVANDLADFARVALTYTIGREDVGLNITTQGTSRLSQSELERWVREKIPLDIQSAIERFSLRRPELYHHIVESSDFFHDPSFEWNKVTLKY